MSDAPRDPMRAAQARCARPELSAFSGKRASARPRRLRAAARRWRARTPAKRPLILPTRALAELVAEEWAGQGETIDPAAMPLTRLANSAIDGVAAAIEATRAEIAGYAGDATLATVVSLVICSLIFIYAYRETGRPLKGGPPGGWIGLQHGAGYADGWPFEHPDRDFRSYLDRVGD